MSLKLRAVVAFYLASGMAALVYEVAFSKYFAFVFGATALASSAVLVAYMAGLASGAYLTAKLEHRIERPLLVYGVAELFVGVFCTFAPQAFKLVGGVYVGVATTVHSPVALSIVRTSLAAIIVIIPTLAAGATLPLLARLVVASGDAARNRNLLSTLYAANTLGGALGSLLSAYVALPVLGLQLTVRLAAFIGITVGVVAIAMGVRWRVSPPKESDEPKRSASMEAPGPRSMILAGASGLLVFAFEVLAVHLLAVIVGTSAYAFGLTLFVFLVCLAFGPPLSGWMSRRWGEQSLFYSLTACAAAIALSTLLWDRLPSIFIMLGPTVKTFAGRELVRAMTAFFALVVPVTLMGTTFPLLLRSVRASNAAADTGKLTAANTLGAIGGSLIGGFALLPSLGSQKSIFAVGLIYGLLALLFRPRYEAETRRGYGWLLATFLMPFVLPAWDLARVTSGANVYFNEGTVPDQKIEWISEDVHGGVTTVVRDGRGQKFLLTNGKFQGNDADEVQQNRGLAHLPASYAPKRDRALVIGLGTGTTAMALAAHGFKRIDLVELSPAIVHAARTSFREVNGGILDDARAVLHVDDGRNLLLTNADRYDVVTIEVSSVWFAGAANLYSKDFYPIVRDRLAPGGILQQWLQLHHTNRRVVATILGSIRAVFPHVLVFVNGHQSHILASMTPITTSREHLFALEEDPAVKKSLGGGHLVDYVKGLVLSSEGTDAFLADTARELGLPASALVSSDDNLDLEYRTPKGNVPTSDDVSDSVAYLSAYRTRSTLLSHLTF